MVMQVKILTLNVNDGGISLAKWLGLEQDAVDMLFELLCADAATLNHFLPLAFRRLAKSKSSLPALELFAICMRLSLAVEFDVLLLFFVLPNNEEFFSVVLDGANVAVPEPWPSMKEN
jgi:hypothetical protein